jgi:hypothetical protein
MGSVTRLLSRARKRITRRPRIAEIRSATMAIRSATPFGTGTPAIAALPGSRTSAGHWAVAARRLRSCAGSRV